MEANPFIRVSSPEVTMTKVEEEKEDKERKIKNSCKQQHRRSDITCKKRGSKIKIKVHTAAAAAACVLLLMLCLLALLFCICLSSMPFVMLCSS